MDHNSWVVTQFFWLMLAAFGVALLARRARLPYPLALVATGLAVGAAHALPRVRLEPSLLLSVFLPPLLFEAGIHLRASSLRRDWKPITVYTLGGTLLSTLVVGGLMGGLLRGAWAPAFVFGALISTTDPISVLAVFKRLGVGRRLSTILEAESLFNDAVGVVLFTLMAAVAGGGTASVGQGVGHFFVLTLGGAALGGAAGFLASRVHAEIDDHLLETTLTTTVAFGSYLGAQALGVSGVMAVVVAGLVVGNVGMPRSMSAGTRLAVSALWEYAAFVVNSLVFLLIGIEAASVHWGDKWAVALGAVGIVLLGRAAIYPLSWVVNKAGGRVPASWQHVLFWGGLRGALSMALVLGLPPDFPQRETLVAATFGVVLFSLLVQGLTIGPLLRRLGLTGGRSASPVSVPDAAALGRVAGERLAAQAALSELARMSAGGEHAAWAVQELMGHYRARLAALERAAQSPDPDAGAHRERQAVRVRRAALSAEKGALQQAERQGELPESDWRRIAARIDAELLALEREG